MQGLSKYYKENYHDLKKILKIFQEYYRNILGIFPQK
jgi:hypothetical protein